MAGMFGAPNGWMALTEQQATQARTALTQAETLRQMAEIPKIQAELPEIEARTRLTQAQASRAQFQTAREQKMLEVLTDQANRGGTDQDPTKRLSDLGNRLIDGGFVEQGTKVLNEVSLMNYRQAAQRHQQTLMLQQAQAARLKTMKDLTTFLGNATDEASFNQGKMAFMAMHPDEQIPPQLQKWNPALVRALHGKAMTEYQQADLALKEQKDRELQDYRKAEEARKDRQHAESLAQQERLAKMREDRADARRKSVGPKAPKIPGDPKNEMVLAIDRQIRASHPDLDATLSVGKDLVNEAAYDIANDVQALRTRNPGISTTEAINQTLAKYESRGVFDQQQVSQGFSIGKYQLVKPTTRTRYVRGGAADLTIPTTPPSGEKARDPSAYKDGQYYTFPKGIFRWDAKKQKMVEVPGEKNRKAANAAVEEGDNSGSEGNMP